MSRSGMVTVQCVAWLFQNLIRFRRSFAGGRDVQMAKYLGSGIDLDRAGVDVTEDGRFRQQVQGGIDTDVAFDLAINFHLFAQEVASNYGFTAHDQMLADGDLAFDFSAVEFQVFTCNVAFDLAGDPDQTFAFDITNDGALDIEVALAGKVTLDHGAKGNDGFGSCILTGPDAQVGQRFYRGRSGAFYT